MAGTGTVVVFVVSLSLVELLAPGLAVDMLASVVGGDGEGAGLPVVTVPFSVTVALVVIVGLVLRLVVSALVRVVCTVVNPGVVLSVALVTSEAVVKLLSVRALLGFEFVALVQSDVGKAVEFTVFISPLVVKLNSVVVPRMNTKAQK